MLLRLDPSTGRVLGRLDLGPVLAVSPHDLAVGDGAVWALLGDTVYRIDPTSLRVVSRLHPASGALLNGVAVAWGAVWVAASSRGMVARIPTTPLGGKPRLIRVGRDASGVTVGGGAVWVSNGLDRTVSKLDPATGRRLATFPTRGMPGGMVIGAGALWIPDGTRAVAALDPRTGRASLIEVGDRPSNVAVGHGSVWVVNSKAGTVSRVDPARRRVDATVPVGPRPYAIAADDSGSVWVAALGPGLPVD
jgi:YVTN family beta-propeller protein